MEIVKTKQAQIELCRTPQSALESYKAIADRLPGLANSARKKARIDLNTLEAEHNFILKDLIEWYSFMKIKRNKELVVVFLALNHRLLRQEIALFLG